jgi:hypothetical protein
MAIRPDRQDQGQDLYVNIYLSSSNHEYTAYITAFDDQLAFLFGVMTLTFTCLVCGYAPEWIPTAYTVQSTFYLTTRFWSYKRKAYHYFLFG